ncbi:MAG: ABC transporter substrate-binding protein [Anaerolineaceae bacterium]|nr:ABC transporter substrate-binding protein [Anaerolineaceae bacterium]
MERKKLFPILAVIVMLFGIIGCTNQSASTTDAPKEVITFGLNNEITGDNPVIGSSSRRGVDLALEEINAAGGVTVGGKKYTLAVEELDNEFKPEAAAVVARKFADDPKIMAMIGPNDSADVMPTIPIIEKATLPSITPWATAVAITENNDYFFRACFTDDFQGAIIAKFAFNDEKSKTAAVLYDMSNDYNVGIATIFKKTFEELGGKVVEFQTYGRGEKDFKAQLTKIIAAKPDILLLPNFFAEIPLQAEQARSLGYEGKFIGSDTWGDKELLKLGGKYVEGALWVGHYAVDIASEKAKAFIAAYQKKYNDVPNDIAALNYDTVYILKLAIENAGKVDRLSIRNGLAGIKLYEGVTGTMKFNDTGDPVKDAVIIKIKDGQFTYYATAKP